MVMAIEEIKFFTGGCPRSQISGKNLEKALQNLGLDIEFEGIDDPNIHKQEGVAAFPTVKVNGEVKSEGKFLTVDACEEILTSYIDS
jgi:hypothetical protein